MSTNLNGARGRRTSAAGVALDSLFSDMRVNEGRAQLVPIVRNFRVANGIREATLGPDDITRKDLQGIAIAWKLPSTVPNFWADNPTEDDLVRALYRHAKRLREQGNPAPHLEPLTGAPRTRNFATDGKPSGDG